MTSQGSWLVIYIQLKTSVAVTNPLVSLLISCNSCYTCEVMDLQHSLTSPSAATWLFKNLYLHPWVAQVTLPVSLVTLPGCHIGDFCDALCLQYSWMPDSCVRDTSFTVGHALSCTWGRFLFVHHNEIRDSIAHLLKEICHDVVLNLAFILWLVSAYLLM